MAHFTYDGFSIAYEQLSDALADFLDEVWSR